MASGDTKTEQMLDVLANGGDASQFSGCCNTKTQTYILGAINRIQNVEDEVEMLENNPDVVDIVATYQDLLNYDTSGLTDKDIIRVLQDETHDGESTYYRYSTSTGEFAYVGESKQYTDFVGTDGINAGESGLVPAPTTADVDKFLKSDGTWDVAGGGGPTVVQTAGTSTTDVMSQKATTGMVFDDPSTRLQVKIGAGATSNNVNTVAVGGNATARKSQAMALGSGATANGERSVAIGVGATTGNNFASIALGAQSSVTRQGELNIGTGATSYGYNNTSYRVIGGVHDGVDAHDVMTVGQANALIDAINTALSLSIPHIGS